MQNASRTRAAFLSLLLQGALGAPEGVGIPLVREAKSAATLVVLGSTPLHRLIPPLLQDELQALLGVRLPERDWKDLPGVGPAVLVADADALPEPVRTRLPLDKIRHDGFVIETLEISGRPVLVVSGKVTRGTYNGAVYLRDLYLRPGSARDLVIPEVHLLRNPRVPWRMAHTADEWSDSAWFPVAHWEWTIDQLAQWGWSHWVPCPVCYIETPKFPEQKIFSDSVLDTETFRRLISYAHERGLKVVPLCTAFFWCGSGKILNANVTEFPSIRAVGRRGGMCPSDPKSRELMQAYLLDIVETFPEIDGIGIDPGDEEGECQCERCRVPLDGHGSHQYGASLISFYQAVAAEVWRRWPDKIINLTVGFEHSRFPGQRPAHAGDVAYYRALEAWDDPRLFLQSNYGGWMVIGEDGRPSLPLERLTPRALYTLWSEGSRHHRELWGKIAERGLMGGVDITEPPDHPHDLGWAYYNFEAREASWESSEDWSIEQAWDRYFFGEEVSTEAAQALRELVQLLTSPNRPLTAPGLLFSRPYRERDIAARILSELKKDGPFALEEIRRWKEYLEKIQAFGERQLAKHIRVLEAALGGGGTGATPRTVVNAKRLILPWLEDLKRQHCLTEGLRTELAAALARLATLQPFPESFTSRRGGLMRWELWNPEDGRDPGYENVKGSDPALWLASGMGGYPDQVFLKTLGVSPKVSGYARACVRLENPREVTLAFGFGLANFGTRIVYEVWINGDKAAEYDEIFGGYVSPEERGFLYVPQVPFDMGDPLVAYLALGRHRVRLKAGANEILVRVAREEPTPRDARLPLSFDLRILDAEGKPLRLSPP